ncbi:MAG: bifunctional oligoribonuclease/PAP phosphatase NrnA [Patescibacteria group bacterium]
MKMYYPLSKPILLEIKKVKNILINIHRNPDLDSIGSATALYQALIKMKKKVTLICPHEIPENFKFLKGADLVEIIDFKTWADTEVRPYETLFLILDSGSYDIVTGDKKIALPDIKKIIIDHHQTNNWKDYVSKILDIESSSTAEVVYQILLDWGVVIDPDIATSIFAGIAGDTVFFKYEKNATKTFQIAAELLSLGADKNKIIEQSFDSFDFDLIQLIGEFLTKMQKGNGYIYSVLDNKTFIKFGKQRGARETVANLFARSIKGFDFGIMAVEFEKDKFALSFRSKSTDVSILAQKFGGGGHKNAAGATIYGNIDQVIKKIKEII